jgi:hypothetical protein
VVVVFKEVVFKLAGGTPLSEKCPRCHKHG